MTKPRTSKVYINDINEDGVLREIQNGLDFIQFNNIVDHNASVFVKPNLTAEFHQPGITTTPLMIRTVVNAIAPCVGRVIIGESDGGNYSFTADNSLRNHGVADLADEFSNVEAVNLSRVPRRRVSQAVCGKEVWVDLPDLLLDEIDCLISVPVLKTHAMTHGSFSIKNLWGCYPDPMRLLYHKDLDYKLALINKLLKNKIQIIDGFWALDGHGPMEGTPVAAKKILVANDPVAADSAAAYLMNLDKNRIRHIAIAEQYGLGSTNMGRTVFNKDVKNERLSRFTPYKIKMDYLSILLFRSVTLSKIVLDSPITPLIYTFINLFRHADKHSYWAEYNKSKRT
jgi:uncharacterized protein (DUF362 family)